MHAPKTGLIADKFATFSGLEIKKNSPSQFASNSQILVASSKILVAKVTNPNKI